MPNPAAPETEVNPPPTLLKRIQTAAAGVSMMLLWVAAWIAGAGKFDWKRGWICTGVYIAGVTITRVLVRRLNKDLLAARGRWNRYPMTRFDKIVLSIFFPLTFLQVVVAGLDAVRFRWLPMPLWTIAPGIVLFLAGMALVTWVMALNPFAEATVRIQTDRGHTVVSAGPYRFMRHPMYLGMISMYPATALMLGSGWAMAVAAIMAALLVWRTAQEDRFLYRELAGYPEFAAKTRFRLVPGIW
jgi:protein-S-isoprenylcysteine O-methyltransferase Ste14